MTIRRAKRRSLFVIGEGRQRCRWRHPATHAWGSRENSIHPSQ